MKCRELDLGGRGARDPRPGGDQAGRDLSGCPHSSRLRPWLGVLSDGEPWQRSVAEEAVVLPYWLAGASSLAPCWSGRQAPFGL